MEKATPRGGFSFVQVYLVRVDMPSGPKPAGMFSRSHVLSTALENPTPQGELKR